MVTVNGDQTPLSDAGYVTVTSDDCPGCSQRNLRSNKKLHRVHCKGGMGHWSCGYSETFPQYHKRLAEERALRNRVQVALATDRIVNEDIYRIVKIGTINSREIRSLLLRPRQDALMALPLYPQLIQQIKAGRYERTQLWLQAEAALSLLCGYFNVDSHRMACWRWEAERFLSEYKLDHKKPLPRAKDIQKHLILPYGRRKMRCYVSIDGFHHVFPGMTHCSYCFEEVPKRSTMSPLGHDTVVLRAEILARLLLEFVNDGKRFVSVVNREGEFDSNSSIFAADALSDFADSAFELASLTEELRALRESLIESIRIVHALRSVRAISPQLMDRVFRHLSHNGIDQIKGLPDFALLKENLGFLPSRRTQECEHTPNHQHQLDHLGRCTACRKVPRH